MKITLIISLIFLLLISFVNSITIQVEPKTTDCFYEDFLSYRDVTFRWEVVRGGKLDINVKIEYHGTNGAESNVLFEKLFIQGGSDHEYKFKTHEGGRYSVCFNNEMSRFTAKVVRFESSGSTKSFN